MELLTSLPGDATRTVAQASVEQTGSDTWRAVVHQAGHVVPNTTYEYRFRVVTADGESLGPAASHRVDDTRLEWQQISGDGVTVWWDRGDRAFAERALDIAERGLASAADLLGVEDLEPVDFFIYSDTAEFREALGPATRENVGGEAHPYIHTLFGLIEPRQVGSDWVEELVVHELAHIVFDEAVANPYGYPPRWLNEGLAVYLATGYDGGRPRPGAVGRRQRRPHPAGGPGRAVPDAGPAASRWPTRRASRPWTTSWRRTARTPWWSSSPPSRTARPSTRPSWPRRARGFSAFEDDWLASLGAERPEPHGPLPAEPGPLPEAWASPAVALLP